MEHACLVSYAMLQSQGSSDSQPTTKTVIILYNGYWQIILCTFTKNDNRAPKPVCMWLEKSKIAIFSQNRIGSKSRLPCTTETILSNVAFCSFTLPCCDEIQIRVQRHHLPFSRLRALDDWRCSAVVWLREGHGCGCFSLHPQLAGNTASMAVYIHCVSKKNRTPATFCNNSNSPGWIAIDFDKNNR